MMLRLHHSCTVFRSLVQPLQLPPVCNGIRLDKRASVLKWRGVAVLLHPQPSLRCPPASGPTLLAVIGNIIRFAIASARAVLKR